MPPADTSAPSGALPDTAVVSSDSFAEQAANTSRCVSPRPSTAVLQVAMSGTTRRVARPVT